VYHVVQLLAFPHSTIRNADMIVVMQQGVVVESDSHEQLLANPTGMCAHFDFFGCCGSGSCCSSVAHMCASHHIHILC
jgi:ABC-type sulfate/molybdate transport systems ATPase subunit